METLNHRRWSKLIVSLEHIWLQSTGGYVMREVSTEEEAFAEMRRFLEVNHIPSDVTTVVMVEEQVRPWATIPRHKEVTMRQRGFIPPIIRSYPNPCFGIYYGTDRPKYSTLGTLEEVGLEVKKDGLGNIMRDDDGHPVLVSNWYEKGNKWYMPLKIYLDDLAKRKAGEK
jgi:hypothetical protein